MKNAKLLYWSVTVALGGFLFGIDTAVISGAEQTIQRLWNLSDAMHGLAVAAALYGTVIGAMFGGFPADRMGRKRTLFWIGILYFISAVGSALAPEVYSFLFLRFIGGLGVGASSVVAPMYISEIAPAKSRGQLVALFQFNIVLGILVAYVSNYLLQGIGESAWRWMLGVEAFPALAYTIMVLFVPESPRWLVVKRNDAATARAVLEVTNPGNADNVLQAIIASTDEAKHVKHEPFFSKKYRFPIILAFLFAFFNQWSGINAIIYYAPRIFESAKFGTDAALLSTAGIGLINLIFTMVGMALIDRFGRRTLMFIGSFGLIVALAMVSQAFYSEQFNGVPIFLFVFIGFFALSQGAVIWVFLSEIFPNEVRAAGQSLGSFTHWIFAAIIANIFPYLVTTFKGGPLFLFFSFMMILQLIFVWRMMPETKGVSLEELQKQLTKNG